MNISMPAARTGDWVIRRHLIVVIPAKLDSVEGGASIRLISSSSNIMTSPFSWKIVRHENDITRPHPLGRLLAHFIPNIDSPAAFRLSSEYWAFGVGEEAQFVRRPDCRSELAMGEDWLTIFETTNHDTGLA